MGPRKIKKHSPLVSKIKNIPPWSYPDAAAAGPAAATSAAASSVCVYYVVLGGAKRPHISTSLNTYSRSSSISSSSRSSRSSIWIRPGFFNHVQKRFLNQCLWLVSYADQKSKRPNFSNDRKITRMALILTIFGPIESCRWDSLRSIFRKIFERTKRTKSFRKSLWKLFQYFIQGGFNDH